MKIAKRIWMSLGLLIIACLGLLVMQNAHAYAYSASAPLGFSEHDIDSAFSGSPCYFKDLSGNTIICNIKRAKNADGTKDGKTYHVTFATKGPVASGNYAEYTQTDNFFCTPDPSVVDTYSVGINDLSVWISGTNPLQGEMDQDGNSQLWPGFDSNFGNGKSDCGIALDYGDGYSSDVVSQGKVVPAPGPASGPGSNYTKSVV